MRSKKHTGKSKTEKDNYMRAIQETQSDSTSGVEVGIAYDASDDSNIEYKHEKRQKTRRKSTTKIIVENLKENWIAYLIPAFFAIAIVGIIDMNRDIGKLEGKVELIHSDIKTMSTDLKGISSKMNTHDTEIVQNKNRLDHVEERLKIKR